MKKFDEKRVYRRRTHRTKVVFEDELGEGLFYVDSEDVSMGGLFLASNVPVRIGTLLFLSFELPGHKRPIRVTGEVVRKADSTGYCPSGMGVRFVGLSDIARRRLEDFLSDYL